MIRIFGNSPSVCLLFQKYRWGKDVKRQCLDKGQTMHTKPPSQAEFEEFWSEAIIKNGLSPSLVDDPLFWKALVTTARMGQSAVFMGKGTALGKRDTTLPHRHTFARNIIPATDKRLHEEGMSRLKPGMRVPHARRRLIMSEDFWDTLKIATLVLKPALVLYCVIYCH